jgi:hypothetical protein
VIKSECQKFADTTLQALADGDERSSS